MELAGGETLWQTAAQNGTWAVLFVCLFIWTLRQNANREDRYLEIIKTLGEEVKARLDKIEARWGARQTD